MGRWYRPREVMAGAGKIKGKADVWQGKEEGQGGRERKRETIFANHFFLFSF